MFEDATVPVCGSIASASWRCRSVPFDTQLVNDPPHEGAEAAPQGDQIDVEEDTESSLNTGNLT